MKIAELTHQQIFTKTLNHLRKQNCRAIVDEASGECIYKGKVNGKTVKCAVGYWIPKNKYNPKIEGVGICSKLSLSNIGLNVRSILQEIGFTDKQIDILKHLQSLHDDAVDMQDMEESFRIYSEKNELYYKAKT